MEKMKIDAIDLIITVLRDHEKALDRLVKKLERFTERTLIGGLSYGQALKAVRAQAYDIRSIPHDATMMRIAIQNFVHALNRAELIPNEWMLDLIRAGTDSLQETRSARARCDIRMLSVETFSHIECVPI